MLADGYSTASVLTLVIPLGLLPIVFLAWWLTSRNGRLKQSVPEQEESGGGTESGGA
jgi:hypothetical protein